MNTRRDVTIAPPAGGRARLRIVVRGAVQGVGFRPFVFRQAAALGLGGWVRNTAEGVAIEAEGEPGRIDVLVDRIRNAPPPHAVIASVETVPIDAVGETGFAIRTSVAEDGRNAWILPDLATCDDCLAELFDPADRRYRYPFINCTQCGPRFTILEDLPYDRARTSMRRFDLCDACRAEYDDPASRRFHAEPNACPECGPQLTLRDNRGEGMARAGAALAGAVAAIRRGDIVAVKGIGGFHLIADATNEIAVARLRAAKQRPDKPFAIMVAGRDDARSLCRISEAEAQLLSGPARPIVLLQREGGEIAPSVAPGHPLLGVMLPYAPLHHLLLRALGKPVVATSGNLRDEPIAIDNVEAVTRLGGVADMFLLHDRPILRPAEDSVARILAGRPLLLRRARGYAPAPVRVTGLPGGILALGGHLKTTIAFSRPGHVLLWPHIGDLDTILARAAHRDSARDIVGMHGDAPTLIACDPHLDYGSRQTADMFPCATVSVPHHVAHVAACLAENEAVPPVLGVAWDGAGDGGDGTIWGGEFLHLDARGWRRVAHIRPFRLPGGEAAMREPRRAAIGLLYAAFGERALAMEDLPPVAAFAPAERRTLAAMLAGGVNAPLCSSVGRLFDAVAALAGVRQRATYEGQAAAELEWTSGGGLDGDCYPLPLRPGATADAAMIVDWRPALDAILADLRAGRAPGRISQAFHNGLVAAIVAVANHVGAPRVALTGGCFQNASLTESAVAALRVAGFSPIWHRQAPPNDGGLALGQAVWAGWRQQTGDTTCA